jgi:hypothetical protein
MYAMAVCARRGTFERDEDHGEAVQDVVSRLLFIASLRPGEKVDVATLSVQTPGILGRFYRTTVARGETRHATLDFIRLTLKEAYGLVPVFHGCGEPFGRTLGLMVVDALGAAKAGLVSLRDTYKHDRMFALRLDTLANALDAKLAGFARLAPGACAVAGVVAGAP